MLTPGILAFLASTLSPAFLLSAAAQSAPAASTSTPPPAPPVQLSVFEVTSDKDVGYQAGNTTSGSRLSACLKDNAAAVMVFTPEFLSDFGVNSLADMEAYAPNMQVDMLDTSAAATIRASDKGKARLLIAPARPGCATKPPDEPLAGE